MWGRIANHRPPIWEATLSVGPPYDARGIANILLDRADGRGLPVTNLALQKLLYFAHARYLVKTDQPLVSGYFEAWEHGPVHPLVYEAFRRNGNSAIVGRARGVDYVRRVEFDLPLPEDAVALDTVEQIIAHLGKLSPSRLRAISHAPRGPWAETMRVFYERNKEGTKAVLGLRISDSVTRERFRFLLVPLDADDQLGDPGEDTPFA